MSGPNTPFGFYELQAQLSDLLHLTLSHNRQIHQSAQQLAQCSRLQQEWALGWVKTLAEENLELAYQFSQNVAEGLQLMTVAGAENWLMASLQVYDQQGLNNAVQHLQAVSAFARQYSQQQQGLSLADVQTILQTFVTGLDGRQLTIQAGEQVYTNTQTLYLPQILTDFSDSKHNFRLYKAIVAHLWAQTRFGTWRLSLLTASGQFSWREKVIRLFHTLERLRLDACIARELPGLARDMQFLLQQFEQNPIPSGWETIAQQLAAPTAQVEDSYQLLEMVYSWPIPEPVCYQGILRPDMVENVVNKRRIAEKQAFQTVLQKIAAQRTDMPDSEDSPRFEIADSEQEHATQHTQSPVLTLDGQPLPPDAELTKLMISIVQDEGSIPTDYLMPAGHTGAAQSQTTVQLPAIPEIGEYLYPEWDYQHRAYRPHWCYVQEKSVDLADTEFVNTTLQQYRGLLKKLRRTFEFLRSERQWLKRQATGEEIDIDTLITNLVEARRGKEISEQIFTQLQHSQRNIAVMFMVDMSGSTKGWVNQAERESLILLSEVLEKLDDRYAIYGFSGMTRKQCTIYPIKRFDEPYNLQVKQRISGIKPQAYTRMGVTIRHLTTLLQKIDATIKILITLSDGRPDDEGDDYRGIYGIEDTRQALLEAQQVGIHPFCITIDTEAQTYLPRMYGTVNYIVIDKVRQLPFKVADIYRKLTT